MPILFFLGKRVLLAAATLLVVSFVVFILSDLLPGDVATRILGRAPKPEELEILRNRLGLDQPLLLRYWRWLTAALGGDFGESLISGQEVSGMLARRLWNSTVLAGLAFLIYVPVAVLPPVVQAILRNGPVDHAISIISLVVLSIPDFLIGTLLIIIFVFWLGVLPAGGADAALSFNAQLLPAATIALVMGTYAGRYLRDSLIDVYQTDYVKMARLNGVPEATILFRHIFPNAMVPFLNITSLNLTYLFGGVVVVEQVFAFPGFGALLVGSLMQLDIPVIQATILVASMVYIAGNLLVDVLTLLLNPRLRYAA